MLRIGLKIIDKSVNGCKVSLCLVILIIFINNSKAIEVWGSIRFLMVRLLHLAVQESNCQIPTN